MCFLLSEGHSIQKSASKKIPKNLFRYKKSFYTGTSLNWNEIVVFDGMHSKMAEKYLDDPFDDIGRHTESGWTPVTIRQWLLFLCLLGPLWTRRRRLFLIDRTRSILRRCGSTESQNQRCNKLLMIEKVIIIKVNWTNYVLESTRFGGRQEKC